MHAAAGAPHSRTPLLHAWPLRAADHAHDLTWLEEMQLLGFPMGATNEAGRTLLHRAVEVPALAAVLHADERAPGCSCSSVCCLCTAHDILAVKEAELHPIRTHESCMQRGGCNVVAEYVQPNKSPPLPGT